MGFFNWRKPSSLPMTLGSTQTLTEMSTRNLPWSKGRPARKAGNLTTICEPIVQKLCEPRLLPTLLASTACYRDNLPFLPIIFITEEINWIFVRKIGILCNVISYVEYYDTYKFRYSDWLRYGRSRGRSSSPGRIKSFRFSKSSRPPLGSTQPPIQWVPGVMRPGRETDQLSPACAVVKKMWIYTSTPPYTFMVWCLIS
jgi:hypothetical protein